VPSISQLVGFAAFNPPYGLWTEIVGWVEQRETYRTNYLSSQTSSIRQPLNSPLTMIVNPFTHGCQQVESRV
jgi:hypothetical protein